MHLACIPSPCYGYPLEANTVCIQQVYWCHLHHQHQSVEMHISIFTDLKLPSISSVKNNMKTSLLLHTAVAILISSFFANSIMLPALCIRDIKMNPSWKARILLQLHSFITFDSWTLTAMFWTSFSSSYFLSCSAWLPCSLYWWPFKQTMLKICTHPESVGIWFKLLEGHSYLSFLCIRR